MAGGQIIRKKKVKRLPRLISVELLSFNILPVIFFYSSLHFLLPFVYLFRTVKMDTGADTPQGITSSADRMVGMEHSEVRYFTRYVISCQLDLLDLKLTSL